MIDRVFDFTKRPCDCVFRDIAGHEVRARILRVSMRKAIVASTTEFPLHLVIGITFDFELGPDLELKARVAGSGENGLFLDLLHVDRDSENRLQTLLVEWSTRERAGEDDDAPAPDPDALLTEAEIDAAASGNASDRRLRTNILKRT
ncbi:MAG: hypothetical protein KDC38_03315, partial [Planctomycetes bacterium]|nr:hypothetical protein [Planctomycetota bacterium]